MIILFDSLDTAVLGASLVHIITSRVHCLCLRYQDLCVKLDNMLSYQPCYHCLVQVFIWFDQTYPDDEVVDTFYCAFGEPYKHLTGLVVSLLYCHSHRLLCSQVYQRTSLLRTW